MGTWVAGWVCTSESAGMASILLLRTTSGSVAKQAWWHARGVGQNAQGVFVDGPPQP